MNVPELVASCAGAVLAGTTVTLSLPKGEKWPPGFPRGELLSVNAEGLRNVAFDPVRVLAWVQQATRNARAIYGGFDVTQATKVSFGAAA
jgi:hypothetical protein